MTPNVPLVAWMPDADPTSPGVMVDVENLLPTARGYAPDHTPTLTGGNFTLSGRCYGAKLVKFATNTPMLLLATARDLYCAFGSLLNVTRLEPYNVVASTAPVDGWQFEAFGDVALAIQSNNPLQVSTNPAGGLAFSDVAGGPSNGRTMAVASNFVMIAPNFAGDTVQWCALEDYTDWTPDLATQAGSKRLLQTPGSVVRLFAYRNGVIAFKAGSTLRGTWVNAPAQGRIWDFVPISTSVGLVGHDAVCEAEGVLYWLAHDGFYRYDGATVVRIRSAPWDWWSANSYDSGAGYVQAHWDPVRRVVRFYYASNSGSPSTALDAGLAYHPETDRWGRFAANVARVASANYETSATKTGANRGVIDAAIVVDATDHRVQSYRSPARAASFTTGDFGNGDDHIVLTEARVSWLDNPDTTAATHYWRNQLGASLTTGVTSFANTDGRYSFSQSARWHRLRVATTGNCELQGFAVDVPKAGKK